MSRIPAILLAAVLGGSLCHAKTTVPDRQNATRNAKLEALEARVVEVAAKVMPATIALVSEDTGASGSGVITSPDGLILTAAHVVQGADKMMVMFPDGKEAPGQVLGADYTRDIAMVRIQGGGKWPHVELGKSSGLKTGDWVVALGHSAGFDDKRTPPVRFGRVITTGPGYFLTTDCTLIGGDSGGPLFDLDGKLIGIHSSIGESLANNNHAGIDGFQEDWNALLAGETWGRLSMNPFANPESPMLGIGIAPVRGVRGVVVGSIAYGQAAEKAGIRIGDIIVSLGGQDITDGKTLLQVVAKQKSNVEIPIQVMRDKERLDLKITPSPRGESLSMDPRLFSNHDVAENPLLTQEEQARADAQAAEFLAEIRPTLSTAAKSTVRLWAGGRKLIGYGTVVGDGSRILAKWSHYAAFQSQGITAESSDQRLFRLNPVTVYDEEDLVLLDLDGGTLPPVTWANQPTPLGGFIAATRPNGEGAAFGVTSVLARDLRESGMAYLGVAPDWQYRGRGFYVSEVTPDMPAARAGVKPGDIILRADDVAIYRYMDLKRALGSYNPGDKISLTLDSRGTERKVEATLGSMPAYSGSRLRRMAEMGGSISKVRDRFPHAIQSDMRPKINEIGGPVVNLAGEAVGITLARADRTKSYIIPANTVQALLATTGSDPTTAAVRNSDEEMVVPVIDPPKGNPQITGKQIRNAARLQEHLGDIKQLRKFLEKEMSELDAP